MQTNMRVNYNKYKRSRVLLRGLGKAFQLKLCLKLSRKILRWADGGRLCFSVSWGLAAHCRSWKQCMPALWTPPSTWNHDNVAHFSKRSSRLLLRSPGKQAHVHLWQGKQNAGRLGE